jgi:tRNA pseudouridine55 synthase
MHIVWKQLGETPLEALERTRTAEGIDADTPMTYAGRLDPAAEGKLIILEGEECKKKDEFTRLSKTYLAEIVLGVGTDTHDLLGIPMTDSHEVSITTAQLTAVLDKFVGTRMQAYPMYSSKTVDGEQLHSLARAGVQVDLPEHEVTLHGYDDVSLEEIDSEDMLARAGEIAALVQGDFRQPQIIESWSTIVLPEKLQLIALSLKVSSGFYVRQFAYELGAALGTKACLYSLVRTEIGL